MVKSYRSVSLSVVYNQTESACSFFDYIYKDLYMGKRDTNSTTNRITRFGTIIFTALEMTKPVSGHTFPKNIQKRKENGTRLGFKISSAFD